MSFNKKQKNNETNPQPKPNSFTDISERYKDYSRTKSSVRLYSAHPIWMHSGLRIMQHSLISNKDIQNFLYSYKVKFDLYDFLVVIQNHANKIYKMECSVKANIELQEQQFFP